jgi:D-cysteine desulfhydrase
MNKFFLFIFFVMKLPGNNVLPLFENYSSLKLKLPHLSLGDFPTPIVKCSKLSTYLKYENLFIKRDDLSGKIQSNGCRKYGGNKIRKLEFIFADILEKKTKSVLTVGNIGSNFALATAIYSQLLNLKCILALIIIIKPNLIYLKIHMCVKLELITL